MSRWEFMRQLEALLFDISPSEREEALQYYNDYFNDAGRENEQEVMKALGSPEQVAKIVKEGLSDNPEMGEFTENGFSSSQDSSRNAIVKRPASAEGTHTGDSTQNAGESKSAGSGAESNFGNGNQTKSAAAGGAQKTKKDGMPVWAIVLIVIGCIFLSPVIIGAAGVALGLIATVIFTVLGLIFGFAISVFVLFIVAIALIVAGFGCILYEPVVSIGLFGGGLICLSVGILFLLLTVFFAGKVLPATCQGIAYIFKKLFGKKEVADHE